MWIKALRGVYKGFYVWRREDYQVLLFSFRYIGKDSFVYRDVIYCPLKMYYSFIRIFLFIWRNAPFLLSEEYFSVYEKYSVVFYLDIKKASGMIVRRLCFIL